MNGSIYKKFKKTFTRLIHKKIVLYGYNKISVDILSNNKHFIILGICSEEKINFPKIKLINIKTIKKEKPVIIITARSQSAEIIFAEIEYLKKSDIEIFFLDGSDVIRKDNKFIFSKYNKELYELKKKIAQHDVISFDLYETLIHRNCSKPRDIFYLLDIYVKKYLKLDINFFSMRIKEATILDKPKPNITKIEEIYNSIKKNYGLSQKIINKILLQEKKLEYMLANENQYLNRMVNFAYSLKKKFL